MLLGYTRVSTDEQDTRLQRDALERVGCERIYEEKASGVKENRPELTKLLDHARKGMWSSSGSSIGWRVP